jgi:hypothetical protein
MRLLRHLSFSNVIAMLALFIALGGAAYAGTKINGSSIKNGSIGGGKLKNETITGNKLKQGTITGAQIAPGSIGSSSIDVATLGTVPSAQTANTAQSATKADSANTANTATTATTATSATTADSAKSAENAAEAKHAESADDATHADTATTAETAGETTKLGGRTAAQLEVTCPTETNFYGGMCWDETTRSPKLWLGAVKECAAAGGRLPTFEELVAFVLQPGEQVTEQTWSGDLDSLDVGKKEVVFTTSESGRSTEDTVATQLGFRCVFPQSN